MTLEPVRPRPLPPLAEDAHKGVAGRVLCVAGSPDMPGAAILSARAAVRAGAGLVTLATRRPEAAATLAPACPEATFLPLGDPPDLGAAAGEGRFHARLIGPGLGVDDWARSVLEALLTAATSAPLLIDADGLNLLAGEPERLRDAAGPRVLTPHPGEARRLAGVDVPRDPQGRIECAAELAQRCGALVCLKGAGTIVTDGQRLYVNSTGNAGMATGGSGDVLAGIAVAYLAHAAIVGEARWDAFDATCQAVWVHGRSGDLAAVELGRRALSASDLVDHLPRAQRELEEELGG